MNTSPSSYIGFWRRFFALIIDIILLKIVMLASLIEIYGWSYFESDLDKTWVIASPADFIMSFIPTFMFIGFWTWRQATPGKLAIKSKIVDAATGEKPTIMRWFLRYNGYILSAIPLGLGFIWVAFDKRKQGWHDKLAGTVVVPLSQ